VLVRPAARALEGVRTAERAGFAARALELPALGASTEEEVAPWRRLLRAARDEAAACTVVGHRPSANGHADTAHALVEAAERPVLVVPETP
jgi:hypothetical protein